MNSEAEMAARYRERLNRLARVLYDHDPYLMGSLIGTPEDEYVPVAGRLMAPLTKARSIEDCAQVLAEHDMRDANLVEEIWRIFGDQPV